MKTTYIQIRISTEDKATWTAQARAKGLTLSEWIRLRLGGTVEPAPAALLAPVVKSPVYVETVTVVPAGPVTLNPELVNFLEAQKEAFAQDLKPVPPPPMDAAAFAALCAKS